MNVTYQVIERSGAGNAIVVRFLTDRITAADVDPQMQNGSPKLRADGLVARCLSDLCIATSGTDPDAAVLKRYMPVGVLAQAEHNKGLTSVLAVESFTQVPEQSITWA